MYRLSGHWPILLVILGTLLAQGGRTVRAGTLCINEVLASNSSILADEQGEYDDWIEIHNGSDMAVDVGGMYLTDDLEEPRRWRFPEDRSDLTRITPGGYLLVWVDGDEQDGAALHASFGLDAGGEEVGLFDRDGLALVDAVRFEGQRSDVSWGRSPDGEGAWRLLAVPTPGQPNAAVYEGFVEGVEFSQDRGFYDGPFDVTLTTATPGAAIWYTTDGSDPGEHAGQRIHGSIYTGPVRIETTTCLRARAVRPGWHPSATRTHTYLFLGDVVRQSSRPSGFPSSWVEQNADYAMGPQRSRDRGHGSVLEQAMRSHRTISLVFDMGDLFDPSRGIYVNARKEGPDWERPVSMEIIDPNGGKEIQVNAGLRMQGSASRSPSRPKHNMRLLFKGMYGTPKLEFSMFQGWPVERFDTLILRGGNGDSWIHPRTIQQVRAQYIRDQWPRDTQVAMGRLTAGQCYVHLYLNGLYWGLYHVIERPNASFFAEHLGGEPREYDAIQHKNGTVDGNRDAWNAMMAIANGGLTSAESYRRVQEYIDLGNLIDWLLVNFYCGNVDWDHNNWYGGRRRRAGETFRFLSWDSERTFLSLGDNVTGRDNANQPTHVHQKLTANSEYRLLFADHVHRHFFNGGVLTPEEAAARWMARADEIRLPLEAESARWGDSKRPGNPYRPEVEWQAELDFLRLEYFPQRTAIVLEQLRNRGLYPDVEAPTLSPHGGTLDVDDLVALHAPAGTIWYTLDGSDPRHPQMADDEASQVLVAEDAPKRVLVPVADPGFWRGDRPFDDSDWTFVTGAPGGVGYDTGSNYQPYISADLIESMHDGNTSCLIRIPFEVARVADEWETLRLRIRYDDGFIAYLNGQEIARRNFDGVPSFNARANEGHPDTQATTLEAIDVSSFLDALHVGENLLAIHGLNVSPTSSDFLISAELVTSQGGPPAMVSPTASAYVDPILLERSGVIRARTLHEGTWSALAEATFSVGPVAESLRISEIMYHPPDNGGMPSEAGTEFIEVQNRGAFPINLHLVRFIDGIDFTFGPTDLPPGEALVVVEDVEAFRAHYGVDVHVAGQYEGKLDNGGERIQLEDAIGRTIADFEYDDDWYKETDGRGHSLVAVQPSGDGPPALGDEQAWRPSLLEGGSPGLAEVP